MTGAGTDLGLLILSELKSAGGCTKTAFTCPVCMETVNENSIPEETCSFSLFQKLFVQHCGHATCGPCFRKTHTGEAREYSAGACKICRSPMKRDQGTVRLLLLASILEEGFSKTDGIVDDQQALEIAQEWLTMDVVLGGSEGGAVDNNTEETVTCSLERCSLERVSDTCDDEYDDDEADGDSIKRMNFLHCLETLWRSSFGRRWAGIAVGGTLSSPESEEELNGFLVEVNASVTADGEITQNVTKCFAALVWALQTQLEAEDEEEEEEDWEDDEDDE